MSENQIHQNAVSVYGQEGLDDFPVLKAFQQYIDAEQIKSRKRMVMLSIFFAVLLTVVIAIFLLVLKDVSSKNQALNDRLIELVSKERDRQPVVVQQPAPAPVQQPANDAALKAMTETLVTLQKQLVEQQQQAKRAPEPPPSAAVPEKPTREQMTIQQKIDSDTEKLKKVQALLKAEKEKIAAEKERLHQQEIEYHRRRLYPDYYEKLDREAATEKREAERPARTKAPAAKKPSAPKPVPVKTPPAKELIDLDDDYDELDDNVLDSISVDVDQFAPQPQKPAVQPKPVIQPKPTTQLKPVVTQPKPIEPPKVVEQQPKVVEPPKPVEPPKVVEKTKTVEQPKPLEQPKVVEQPKPVEPTQTVDQPKPEAVQPTAVPEPVKKPTDTEPVAEPTESKPADLSIPVEINGAESDWLIPTT